MTDDGANSDNRANDHGSGSDRAMRIIAAIQTGATKASFVRNDEEAAMWDRLARRTTQARSSPEPDQRPDK